MNRLQIGEIRSYAQHGEVNEGALLSTLAKWIRGQADVYAVMDHAVVLGRYQDEQIQVKLSRNEEITRLSMGYLQELRVFRKEEEFRALRNGNGFHWRWRIDDESWPETLRISKLDEVHKLWGSVREDGDRGPWSLLTSQRGSSIYFPGVVPVHGEKGILVRNYLQFHTGDGEKNGIVQYVDERLCCFVDWPSREEGGIADAI